MQTIDIISVFAISVFAWLSPSEWHYSNAFLAEVASNIAYFSLSVLASVIASIFGYYWGRRRTKSHYLPRRVAKGTRKNTILVVGLGASGKSSLIQMLTKTLNLKRPKRTDNFAIHPCIRNESGEPPALLIFSDYRGQDFSQLISGFVEEQLEPKTWLRYGDVNTLILVVDLFSFKENEDPSKTLDDLDEERIKIHIGEWNSTAMDAVFGLLSAPSLKYVCLFINKIDKWSKGNQEEATGTIKQKYEPLIRDLERRTRKSAVDFDVIVGSAFRGDAVLSMEGGLAQRLFNHAEEIGKGETHHGQ